MDGLLEAVWADPAEYAEVLAECAAGTRDERVRRAIGRLVEFDPSLGAACAVLFRDPTLVPALVHALNTLDPLRLSPSIDFGQAMADLAAAVVTLRSPSPPAPTRFSE